MNFVGMEPGEKVAAIAQVAGDRGGLVRRHAHAARSDQEDRGHRVRELSARRASSASRSRRTTSCSPRRSPTATREFLIATKTGKSIRFDEEQVRPMGRGTVGVKAIDARRGRRGRRPGASPSPSAQHVLAVCERGYGKRTVARGVPAAEPRRQGHHPDRRERSQRPGRRHRDGQGRATRSCSSPTAARRSARRVAEIRETGRNAQGVKLMSVEDDERIVAIERLAESPPTKAAAPSELPPDWR